MPTRHEIGIVGLRKPGNTFARNLRYTPHEFVGTDVEAETRRAFEDEFGVETFETPGEMYESGVDAVIITTPNKFHEAAAVAALERGLHVLVEKPLAHDIDAAERIAAAAEQSDATCVVGFHHRCREKVDVLKSYVDAGKLGDIYHINAEYCRRRGIPGRGTWYTSRKLAGGGALIDIGVHAIDLVMYLFDFPEPTTIEGSIQQQFGQHEDYSYLDMWGEDGDSGMFDVEDTGNLRLEFEDGNSALIEFSWATNGPLTHEYKIRGSEMGAHLDIHDDDLALYESGNLGRDHFIDSRVQTRSTSGFENEVKTFLNGVSSGDFGALSTVSEALQVQQIVHEIYRTAELGTR